MKKRSSPEATPNPDSMPEQSREDFLVVGIGASAGGIKALKEFFSGVPKDSGNAYVVILHLSPEYESQLAEILQTAAVIPVRQVNEERVAVEPDCVYVIPPNKSLSMLDGHLATAPIATHEERRAPVDIFFRTLAESQETRAVSVILSGTGPDGSMGIKRVKEKGGVIFVQDPKEAEYADMPRNAIATGLVDSISPAVDIPGKISEYKNRLGKIRIPIDFEESADESDEKALRDVFTHLRVRTGHDFTNYKRATILRRIERRMNVQGLTALPDYAQLLRATPEETQALLKDLLISVTNFFRDREAFEKLEREVIPRILENKDAKDSVRVWVAGCATGEEAYSIAMLFAELTEKNADAPSVQIFATDIDDPALAQARAGLYSNSDVADVSPDRLNAFFNREGDNFRVRREIREMILFASHNVTKDPPFSHLDLVTCRNLLIYLNRIAQKRVMETTHFALEPGGFLFLGNSESVEGDSDLFVAFDKEKRIFQSRPVAARLSIPMPNLSPQLFGGPRPEALEQRRSEEVRALERLSYTALHQQLLEQYAPPSVVVNEEYDILHVSESAGRYLQIMGGEPSLNLLRIARADLRLDLRNALYQAVQKRLPVTAPNVQVRTDESVETVNIIVRPVMEPNDAKRGYILVIFEPSREAAETKSEIVRDIEPVARQLEEELTRTKAQLRVTVEQYEIQHEELKASNEELQAINEELRSASEELETSKEELQSVNEELHTVNQELKIKIEELSQSNDDFHNLLNSTDIGTIFLDRSLNIKMYTKSVVGTINLLPSDLGRPLSDITNRFNYDGIVEDSEKVLRDLRSIEREVRTTDGRWFLMRLYPYRTTEDRIDGAVLTFLDITLRKEAEMGAEASVERLRESERRLMTAMNVGRVFSWEMNLATREFEWSSNMESVTGFPLPGSIDKMLDLIHPDDLQTMRAAIDRAIETKGNYESEYRIVNPANGEVFCFQSQGAMTDGFGEEPRFIGITRNITDHKQAEEKLRKSEEQLQLILESATDYAIITQDENGEITSWNKGAENLFGFTAEEAVGLNVAVIFTGEDRAKRAHIKEIENARTKGRAEDERWHVRKDGSRFFASGVLMPLRDGGLAGYVKIARDQTEKRAAEVALRDREVLQQLVTMQEDERRRIARDLHDHLGQQLTVLRMKLEAVKKICVDEKVCEGIENVQQISERLDKEVDFLAWELRPASLDDLGLRVALGNFVREWSHYSGVPTDFHSSGLGKKRLGFETETNLYRIAQEALNNIYKHAKAKNVSVLLERRRDGVVLIIEDDGAGFKPKDKKNRDKGIGLTGMKERAKILGGELEIESAPKRGTTVFARVPAAFTTEENGND